jgi:hypothetical protein
VIVLLINNYGFSWRKEWGREGCLVSTGLFVVICRLIDWVAGIAEGCDGEHSSLTRLLWLIVVGTRGEDGAEIALERNRGKRDWFCELRNRGRGEEEGKEWEEGDWFAERWVTRDGEGLEQKAWLSEPSTEAMRNGGEGENGGAGRSPGHSFWLPSCDYMVMDMVRFGNQNVQVNCSWKGGTG